MSKLVSVAPVATHAQAVQAWEQEGARLDRKVHMWSAVGIVSLAASVIISLVCYFALGEMSTPMAALAFVCFAFGLGSMYHATGVEIDLQNHPYAKPTING